MYDISVVIPTYNREKYIGRAVETVLAQKKQGEDYRILEILIVDDGSTDNTSNVINAIGDDRIVYHPLPVNGGAIAAWNTGINIAKGDWIAFQDSDDEWHEDKLFKQVAYAIQHPDCSLISHQFKAFFADGTDMCTRVVDSDNMIKELAQSNFIGTPTMLVKKNALLDTGGFNDKIKALQDWDFVVKFASKYKIGMVPEVLLDVDMTVEGMSADASKYYESRCRIIAENKKIFIENGCFDDAVKSLLLHASKNDILEQVGKMLEIYLQQG